RARREAPGRRLCRAQRDEGCGGARALLRSVEQFGAAVLICLDGFVAEDRGKVRLLDGKGSDEAPCERACPGSVFADRERRRAIETPPDCRNMPRDRGSEDRVSLGGREEIAGPPDPR